MKKLLIFMLVLGMASLASALPTSLQISVGGVMEPTNSDIYLLPTETIVIDIWTTTEIYSGGGLEGYFSLGVDPTYGSFTGGTSQYPTETGTVYYSGNGAAYLPSTEAGDFGTIGSMQPSGSGMTGVIFDMIIFHCEAEGDAVINLYSVDFGATPYYSLIDTVTIHQIPEPMTVLLLGLGGLFLRRRK